MPKFSSWKEGAVVRRTTRQAPAVVRSRPQPNNKKTKRWCKGKEGVEHRPAVKPYATLKNQDTAGSRIFRRWLVLYCSVCGRELAHYYHFGSEKTDPPDWVKKYKEEQARGKTQGTD